MLNVSETCPESETWNIDQKLNRNAKTFYMEINLCAKVASKSEFEFY